MTDLLVPDCTLQQPQATLLLSVPKNTFAPPNKHLYPDVIALLKQAGEIAKDTGRVYVHPCHLALAVLNADYFSRPDKPANLTARLTLYLSDLLEKAGQSLDIFRRVLWRNAVRLPIQEGYGCDEIYHSTDLLDFLRNHCLSSQYYCTDPPYPHYLLKALIRHESLSVAMRDFPLTAAEVVKMIGRLESHALAAENKVDFSLADDLTAAEEAQQSPVIGRCNEISRMIHILSCRNKNMPLLVGKPGVGKTTIARILAQRVLEGRVPQHLSCRVISLSSSGKEDIKSVLTHIKSARSYGIRYILFIDDIHELSKSDVPKLKRYLQSGDVRCIGTTTPGCFDDLIKQYGSMNYFSDIQIVEPSVPETINILRILAASLTAYHGGELGVKDTALHQAAHLAKRFLASKIALPKSAVHVLDQACALVRTQRSQASESWEFVHSRKVSLQIEIAALKNQMDPPSLIRFREASTELISVEEQCLTLQDTLRIEQEHRRLYRQLALLQQAADDARNRGDKFLEHDIRYGAIPDLQARFVTSPMNVTADVVSKVVSISTGFPIEKLKSTEQEKILNLDTVLAAQVVGQPEATKAVADAIQLAYSGLTDPSRPVASFLLVGPTGTGKTLLAKTLAKTLFDSPEAMVRIDASEYSENHNVARLIGSPPGYIGYEEGGQLTNHVRKNPYTIILVDEIEKAAPKFVTIFLQVLDDGRLTDGHGDTVDFRNTVIIMTSNLGSSHMMDNCSSEQAISPAIQHLVTCSIQAHFPPEFLNRIDETIFYRPLSRSNIRSIIDIRLQDYTNRLKLRRIRLVLKDCAKDHLSQIGYSPIYGARPLARVMRERILNPLAKMILRGDAPEGGLITICFNAETNSFYLEPSEPVFT